MRIVRFATLADRETLAVLVMAIGLVACGGSPASVAAPSARAALLEVDGTSGADVEVDGVHVGTLPLEAPVAAEPGRHQLAVTLNGHVPASRALELRSGVKREVTFDLDETGQRTGAWIALGAGAGWVATGIVFGVLAVVEDRNARDLVQRLDQGVTSEETSDYDQARAARDLYRLGSGIAVGSGLGLFVLGACLFAFDERPLVPSSDVTVVPLLHPGLAGATAAIRF
jgi:hypothetical protein